MRFNLICSENKLPVVCGFLGCKCKTFKKNTAFTLQCAYCGTIRPIPIDSLVIPNILGRFPYKRKKVSEIVECHVCRRKFRWQDGGEGGNIYSCEDDCGNYICISCMLEQSEYREEIYNNVDGISGLKKILCLDCYGRE